MYRSSFSSSIDNSCSTGHKASLWPREVSEMTALLNKMSNNAWFAVWERNGFEIVTFAQL